MDTPGIHRPHFRMNAAMVRDATDALATADVVLWIVDASEKAGKGEAFILELLERAGSPAILALNKIDLVAKERLLPMIADFSSAPRVRRDRPDLRPDGGRGRAPGRGSSPATSRKGSPPTRRIS